MEFALRLKEMMDENNLNPYRLSKKIHVHQTTIKNWLDGKVPSATYLEKLSESLNVSIDYLLGNTPHRNLASLIKTGLTDPSAVAKHFPTEAAKVEKYTVNFEPIIAVINDSMTNQGITTSELAALSGISEQRISKLLDGQNTQFSPLEIRCIGQSLNADLMTPFMENSTVKKKTTLDAQEWIRKNAIPIGKMKPIPVVGVIRAGMPILAEENIEYYDFADVSDANDYFYLRVLGDSMIGAGIPENSIVLIKKQNTAENGQIVACLVNGEDATLKRFKQQSKTVLLMPENSKYEPIVLSCDDFDNGYAKILGVAKEVKVKLQ